jgi:hypothetical protein
MPCTPTVRRALQIVLALVLGLGAAVAAYALVSARHEGFETATPTVVLVHATWNAESRALLAPRGVWDKLKRELPGVRFDERDETSPEGSEVAKYPSVRVVSHDGVVAAEHSGPMEADALKSFVLMNVPADALTPSAS